MVIVCSAMLYELFIVLLLAVDFISPLKKSTRLSKKVLNLPAACARIKCPHEERPACARLVYRQAQPGAGAGTEPGTKTVYVVMLNECEINYVKCHEGHKRAKRDLASGLKRQGYEVSEESDPEETEVVTEENEEDTEENEEDTEEHDHGDRFLASHPARDISIHEGIEDVSYDQYNLEQVQKPDVDAVDQEFTDQSLQEVDTPHNAHDKNPNDVDWPHTDSASAELIFNIHAKGKKTENPKKYMDDDEPDMSEYQAPCPEACPARDVMVCARCQHAVHRTFPSVCHMRQFQCEHQDDKLYLVSRFPCMMSAPYLAEPRKETRGRVREAGVDDDLVLRFLRCRALDDKAKADDPRCYLQKQKLMLQLETYNISDQY